ncbi:MAG: hypothetical protein M1830_008020 [Pleopsidium flavum]|nr:MAG: hypothetical protein M1830_008020 [Pleopsidium flavum]
MPTLHQTFTPVKIHTAKCDICNQHNRSVLFRCADCGWHVCSPCWAEKGGDGTHVVNEGDRGWTWERAGMVGVGGKRVVVGSRRTGRGRIVVGEDEDGGEEEKMEGVEVDVGESSRELMVRKSRRQRGREGSRDLVEVAFATNLLDPTAVLAAADFLIQAASGASPSLSPPPRDARLAPDSGHESANIARLLRAAAQIDHTRPAAGSGEASSRARSTSPLFVPQGTPPQVFEGLDMTPEPTTPESIGREMADDWDEDEFESSNQLEPVELEQHSPIPTASQGNIGARGEAGRGDSARSNRRKFEQRGDILPKVPVAKRLRDLYQKAVLVKDRKGRMRKPGGGAVVRRSEM